MLNISPELKSKFVSALHTFITTFVTVFVTVLTAVPLESWSSTTWVSLVAAAAASAIREAIKRVSPFKA